MKDFNKIEMDKEYQMSVDIKAIYHQEMTMMDAPTKQKASQWKKHFDHS